MSEYKPEDIVLVGWPTSGGPPDVVPSTQVNCHKCGQSVWVSNGSMNTVLDAKVKSSGELYIICLMCSPEPDSDIFIGNEQKEEMLRAGFDIDKFMRDTGMNLTQIAKFVVEKAQAMEDLRGLHRAANPGGCGSGRCSVYNPKEAS